MSAWTCVVGPRVSLARRGEPRTKKRVRATNASRPLTPGDGSYDKKRLGPGCDGVGQRGVRRLVGKILLAGEKPYERPALLRDVIAHRPAQHRIAGFERVQHRPLRGHTLKVELDLALDARQSSQMLRKYDSDHGSFPTAIGISGRDGDRHRLVVGLLVSNRPEHLWMLAYKLK